MLKVFVFSLALCVALLAFSPAVAYAQDAGPEPDPVSEVEADPLGGAVDLVSAIKDGDWRMVGALVLALLMMLAGKFRDKIKWLKGDRGGAVLVMGLALAGAFATVLASSVKLDLKLILGAVGVAWTAVGGYTWIKRLIWPKADPEEGE